MNQFIKLNKYMILLSYVFSILANLMYYYMRYYISLFRIYNQIIQYLQY